MKSYLTCLALLGFVGLAGAGTLLIEDKDDGDEQKVSVDQLPSVVRTTLLKEVGTGKIVDLVKETKGGAVTYEADVKIDGATWEMRIAEDGKLLSKQLEDEDDDDDDDADDDDDHDDAAGH